MDLPTKEDIQGGPPTFHAMDSLDVRPKEFRGALRPEFENVLKKLVQFLEYEAGHHPVDGCFGPVPTASSWKTRQMSNGVRLFHLLRHPYLCVSLMCTFPFRRHAQATPW